MLSLLKERFKSQLKKVRKVVLHIFYEGKISFYNKFMNITIMCGGNNNKIHKLKLFSIGKDNIIYVGDNVRLQDIEISIRGNHNQIVINGNNQINNIRIAIEDDNNQIMIDEAVYIGANTLLAALEGTRITIGRGCMIAEACEIRTSDSHSILDLKGERINPASNIYIGKHVWIGVGCILLKGCHIPDNSIIAARSVVTSTKGFDSFSLFGGTPAKLLKRNVNWLPERIISPNGVL